MLGSLPGKHRSEGAVAERKEVRNTSMIRFPASGALLGATFRFFKGKASRRFFHLLRMVVLGTHTLIG